MKVYFGAFVCLYSNFTTKFLKLIQRWNLFELVLERAHT